MSMVTLTAASHSLQSQLEMVTMCHQEVDSLQCLEEWEEAWVEWVEVVVTKMPDTEMECMD